MTRTIDPAFGWETYYLTGPCDLKLFMMKQLGVFDQMQPLVYSIDLHKSKRLLRAFVEAYNENKLVRDQIRVNHLALMTELLEIYRIFLWRQQAQGVALVPGHPLPYFRVNNVQLGQFLMCSDRSVQNLRHRLKAAKLIVNEIWHGSNSSYEVQLNPAIIHLAKRGDSGNHAHLFGAREKMLGTPKFEKERQQKQGRQTTLKGEDKLAFTVNISPYCNQLQIQDTNKFNKLEVLDLGKGAENQINRVFVPVENHAPTVEKVRKAVDRRQNRDFQGTLTGYETIGDRRDTSPPVAAAPPGEAVRGDVVRSEAPSVASDISPRGEQKPPLSFGHFPRGGKEYPDAESKIDYELPPETFGEVVRELPDHLGRRIFREVSKIWEFAQKQLYDDHWIAATEAERAKARLAEYFIGASPKKYEAGTKEICGRIRLVRKWIERGKQAGKKRWVPIPSLYFDCRNHRGFRVTKAWYKKHLKKRAEISDNIALTKAVRQYKRCLAGEDRIKGASQTIGPADMYLALAARLSKRNVALLERFQKAIVEHSMI